MPKLFASIMIGIIAGIIDVVPMMLQKLDKYACASAFFQWIALGIMISYVQMPIPSFLKGTVIAVLTAVPIMIIVSKENVKSIIPILIMSVILGAAVGIATNRFANE